MSQCRVSVIIPTYKRAEKLKRAIDSVLGQSFFDLEVIVVDDNNPDTEYRKNVETLMASYSGNSRVRYIQHEQNRNGAAARNTGIRAANAKYIAFLDDDDFYYPEKIKKEYDYLEKQAEHAGVYCGRFQHGRQVTCNYEGDLSEQILLQTFTPTTPALMFRKESLIDIGGFDESFRRHQDYELLLKFFRKYTLGSVSEVLIEIGTNEGENELHGEELERNKLMFLEQFEKDILRIDSHKRGFKKKVYCVNYRAIYYDHLSHGNIARGWQIYKKGCKEGFFTFNLELVAYFFHYVKVKVLKKVNKKH